MFLKAIVGVLLIVQIFGVELANEDRKYQEDDTHVSFTDDAGRQVKLSKEDFQSISHQYHKDHKKPKKEFLDKKHKDYKIDNDKQFKKENKDNYLRKAQYDTNEKRINDKNGKQKNKKFDERNDRDDGINGKKRDYHEKHGRWDHKDKQERREVKKSYHNDRAEDDDDDNRANEVDGDDDNDDDDHDEKRHQDKRDHQDEKRNDKREDRRNKDERRDHRDEKHDRRDEKREHREDKIWKKDEKQDHHDDRRNDDHRKDKKRHFDKSEKYQKHYDNDIDDDDDDDNEDESRELLHDTDVNLLKNRPINKDSEPVPNIKENFISNYQNAGNIEKRIKKDFYKELKSIDLSKPPSHNDTVLMARYIVHKADWASLATISSHIGVKNFPFVNIFSMSDGPVDKGIGVPFFYMTPLDISSQDLGKDSHCSITVTLAQTDYCKKQALDPEDPRCARVILSGKLKKVKADTTEEDFAEEAIFSRHPQMKSWPSDHDWYFAKLKIAQILVLDYFGGAKNIDVQEYINAEPKK